MSTLVEVITQGSINGALTGVKRPLSNPTAVPTQLPAFRGIPNDPGNAIKAPKLMAGNRTDRGTNVLTPVARVTALTSIGIDNGRLSPGDVAFVRRTPGSYLKAIEGPSAGIGHMTDMFGVDGVNRFLSGTLNGARVWRIGDNLVDSSTTKIDDTTNLFGFVPGTNFTPYLSALREYQFDGVILSNEEPYSFIPNGGRDATVFNVGIKGAAPVNNGFMTYDTHAPTELYARGADPLAYGETLRIGSERAGDTWHGKIGYDFVAAYTSVYTEYPLQMFGRDLQPLDTAYLILRKFNLLDDVVMPRANALLETTRTIIKNGSSATKSAYDNITDAKSAVLNQLRVQDADGKDLNNMTDDKLHAMVFFQYMPCSSRAFVKYHETLKLVDAEVAAISPNKFDGLLHTNRGSGNPTTGLGTIGAIRNNYAHNDILAQLLQARIDVYVGGVYKQDRMNIHDPVRFLDLLLCAGAWKLGKVVDTRSARGTPYGNGPTNGSYRMTVVMDIDWLPRNKSIEIPQSTSISDAALVVKKVGRALHRPTVYWHQKGRAYASEGSKERNVLSAMSRQTLAERELHEAPLLPLLLLDRSKYKVSVSNPAGEPLPEPPTLAKLRAASGETIKGIKAANAKIQENTNISAETKENATRAMQAAEIKNRALIDANARYLTVDADAAIVEYTRVALESFLLILDSVTTPDTPDIYENALRTSETWVKDPSNDVFRNAAEEAYDLYLEELRTTGPLVALQTSTRPSGSMDLAQRHRMRMTLGQKTNAILRSHADAARTAAIAPMTAAVTTAAAKKNAGKQPIAPRAAPPAAPTVPVRVTAPQPRVDRTPLVSTRPVSVSDTPSIVDATIAASRKATAPNPPILEIAEAAPASTISTGVVDSVFDKIFGAPASDEQPLASASSPTPSSGSETGPRAFNRRSR